MKIYVLAFFTVFFISYSLQALEINDRVPNFEAIDSTGETWNSQKFRERKHILLYFYPAAMTGGCTKQACAYRDDHEKWKKLEVEVVGISGDQSSNLSLFKKAEKLPFTLLSDTQGKVAKLFNVPIGKGGRIERFFKGDKFTLERGVTSKRWTFLISKSGKLIYKNDQVSASQDSENVMKFLNKKN
jgi:peroxiredoxin Q/BCP